jgi:hypothetical protein
MVVGIPVTAPVEAFKLKPGGKLPDVIENEYVGVPPVAGNK